MERRRYAARSPQVFGAGNEVQRCRNHKLRNVVGHLPNAQHDQARATLRAAWKLEAKEGMRKLDQYASCSNATGPMQQRAFEKASMRSSP